MDDCRRHSPDRQGRIAVQENVDWVSENSNIQEMSEIEHRIREEDRKL